MQDLQSAAWIKFKAILFVVIGVTSAGLLLGDCRTVRAAVLLALAIWSFCRAYYFAFYVIEKYVDPSFRFSGLWSAVVFLARRRPR
jgi:hypothetical protein